LLKSKRGEIAQKGDTLKRRRREKGQLFHVEQFQEGQMQLKKVRVNDIITENQGRLDIPYDIPMIYFSDFYQK